MRWFLFLVVLVFALGCEKEEELKLQQQYSNLGKLVLYDVMCTPSDVRVQGVGFDEYFHIEGLCNSFMIPDCDEYPHEALVILSLPEGEYVVTHQYWEHTFVVRAGYCTKVNFATILN